jgi:hypothetical protein
MVIRPGLEAVKKEMSYQRLKWNQRRPGHGVSLYSLSYPGYWRLSPQRLLTRVRETVSVSVSMSVSECECVRERERESVRMSVSV